LLDVLLARDLLEYLLAISTDEDTKDDSGGEARV